MERLKIVAFSIAAGAALFLLGMSGCRTCPLDLDEIVYTPLVRGDWEVSSPEEQGLDSTLVAQMYCRAASLDTIYSLLVIKNNLLVAEDYFNDGSVDRKDRL